MSQPPQLHPLEDGASRQSLTTPTQASGGASAFSSATRAPLETPPYSHTTVPGLAQAPIHSSREETLSGVSDHHHTNDDTLTSAANHQDLGSDHGSDALNAKATAESFVESRALLSPDPYDAKSASSYPPSHPPPHALTSAEQDAAKKTPGKRRNSSHSNGGHRKILKKRYTKKIHAYAVPEHSYFAPLLTSPHTTHGPDALRDARATGWRHQAAVHSPAADALLQTAVTRDSSNRGQGTSPDGRNAGPGRNEDTIITRKAPRRLAGRLIDQQRYNLPKCPPYRIPLYDQACFKYIFPNLFKNAKRKNKFEFMQLLFLALMFILAIVNMGMTVVNVFFNDPIGNILPWASVLVVVIFSLEFAVVALMFLFMLVLVAHAVIVNKRGRASDVRRWKKERENMRLRALTEQQKPRGRTPSGPVHVLDSAPSRPSKASFPCTASARNPAMHRRKNGLVIGTSELARDFATLITLIGTFSVLRIIGLASPSFAFRRIVPIFQNALTGGDVMKGLLFLLLWVLACVLAFLIMIAKVTQISFAFTESIGDWSIVNYVQLVGLLFNLARVDDSYYKETSVLLDAVHQHYSEPGEVKEYFPTWAAGFEEATQDLDEEYEELLAALRAAEQVEEMSFTEEHLFDAADTPAVPASRRQSNRTVEDDVRPAAIVEAEAAMQQSVRNSHTNRARRFPTDGEVLSENTEGAREGENIVSRQHPHEQRNSHHTTHRFSDKEEKEATHRPWYRFWSDVVNTGQASSLTQSSSLLTRIMRALHIPPFMYFIYFDVMYDYHFNSYQREDAKEQAKSKRNRQLEKELVALARKNKGPGVPSKRRVAMAGQTKRNTKRQAHVKQPKEDNLEDGPPQLPMRTHVYNFFNYLSFIFEIDNVQLRRYLQMIHSPLPFYRTGRDSFAAAFVEKDVVGMDMALWRSDPVAKATQRYARAHPEQFDMAYICEDRRDIWDAKFADWAQLQEMKNAVAMAHDVAQGVIAISENGDSPVS